MSDSALRRDPRVTELSEATLGVGARFPHTGEDPGPVDQLDARWKPGLSIHVRGVFRCKRAAVCARRVLQAIEKAGRPSWSREESGGCENQSGRLRGEAGPYVFLKNDPERNALEHLGEVSGASTARIPTFPSLVCSRKQHPESGRRASSAPSEEDPQRNTFRKPWPLSVKSLRQEWFVLRKKRAASPRWK